MAGYGRDNHERNLYSMLNDKSPEYWFMISKHDSESANSLLAINGYADIIIYHYHQAVEKLLKGYCIQESITFPFIHDLERLYSLLSKKSPKYVGVDEQIIILNNYSNQLRYPESDNLSIEDAKDAKNLFCELSEHLSSCSKNC